MKYISKTISDFILGRIDSQLPAMQRGQKMMFMVQTLPEELTLATADLVSSSLLKRDNINLIIKIAKVLTDQWTEESKARAKEAGWLTILDNLAYYRNETVAPDKYNVIVLCGSDAVIDAASLADFNLCSLKMVWETEMSGSVSGWVADKLRISGIDIYNKADLQSFDKILLPIMNYGRADLISISRWLDDLDLTYCDTVKTVLDMVLDHLQDFQLPNFSSFPYDRKNKSFSPYVYKAIDFFSYTMFIEDRQKKKAIKAIDGILEAIETGDDSWEILNDEKIKGSYDNGQEFLAGLKSFIQTNDQDEKEKLFSCDFVFILDKILKYKRKQEKKKNSVKRLKGSPVEMVLTALWDSFYDLSRSKDTGKVEDISKIEITGELFKHDMEWDESEGDYSTKDVSELAKEFLHRLIGGLDGFIPQHLSLKNKNGADVEISCRLEDDEIKFRYSRTAVSELAFVVNIYLLDEEMPQERKYAWKIRSNHSYRLVTELMGMAADAIDLPDQSYKLPFFNLPYYDEILKTTSNEELRRVFLHSLRDSGTDSSFTRNLLSVNWLGFDDPLLPYYKKLAEKYHQFIKSAHRDGLMAALSEASVWDALRQQYEEVLDQISTKDMMLRSPMAGMIVRAFMVIRERGNDAGDAWYGEPFEESGIITVLHPSLLEMVQSQAVYLASCFSYAVKAEIEKDMQRDSFKKHIWQSYMDLSHIRTPINCILYDDGLNLNTNVIGHDLIHKVGCPRYGEDLQSTRLVLGLSDEGDDEQGTITDTDLFLETRESKLLNNLLTDYFRLHPHARDGLSLAIYRNQDIQPIVAALHAYLMKLSNPKDPTFYVIRNERNKPYYINVSIFTDSADESGISRWIELWRERWEAAETENKFQVYRNCRFSISHRLINKTAQKSFLRMVNDNFNTDLAILYDIIGTGNVSDKFDSVDPMDIRTHSLKYPILEKAVATIDSPADEFKRFRIISNRQFSLSSKLASCMHAFKSGNVQTGTVVMGTGDLKPWMEVLGAIHKKSEWVVCIDPSVDDRLIRDSGRNSDLQREIIGFGSGVGISGEENYTISTEHFSLKDIELRLRASIKQLIGDSKWTDVDYQEIAKGTMKVALQLSGLSLVRATGAADQYIRDFLAYALTRKILGRDDSLLCDNLVTLDAYRHWFDFAETGIRPDLLWLKVRIGDDNRLELDLHLIECKMGNKSDELLLKAKRQINNGLKVLIQAFKPNFQENQQLDDDKPDRRYWWMQLHRLIAAKAKIDTYHKKNVISALERLAEGDYKISWNASVMAFWIDDELGTFKKSGSWKVEGTITSEAYVYTIGRSYIKEIAQSSDEMHSVLDDVQDEPIPDNENAMQALEDIDLPLGPDEEDDFSGEVLTEWGDEDTEDEDVESTPDWTSNPTSESTQGDGGESQTITDTEPPSEETDTGNVDNTPPDIPRIPERILLGKTTGGKEVFWEFGHPKLLNRHIFILGTSGTGKTYAIQCILNELARAQQRSLILDYTDGFIPSKIEENAKQYIPDSAQNFIRLKPLPINPFKASITYEAGLAFQDTPDIIAKRVASIFKSVYTLGEQQFSLLVHAISSGISKHGDNYNLNTLLRDLPKFINNSHYTKTTIQTTITKISPFITSNPFTNETDNMSWNQIFADVTNWVTIFQFFQMDKDSARALIEFVLWDLYHYVSKEGTTENPSVVVLDEIQNLDLGQNAPVAKYLTEGRKHGLALISATQTLRGIGGVTDAKVSRLSQSELKLFFKPSINEIREHAQLLHVSFSYRSVSDWSNELSKLKKGECWAVGTFVNEQKGLFETRAMKVKIASLEERGFHA